MAKAYLVGSGVAALSAAAFLIRDGGFAGSDIVLLEEQDREGGSLDAAGSPETGYTMRGGRMFEIHFDCTYDLLGSIPPWTTRRSRSPRTPSPSTRTSPGTTTPGSSTRRAQWSTRTPWASPSATGSNW